MKNLEDKIRKYSNNPEKIIEAVAIMKVGRDKGDDWKLILRNAIAHVLLDFHGIPLKTGDS